MSIKKLRPIDVQNPPSVFLVGNGFSQALGGAGTGEIIKNLWKNKELSYEAAKDTIPFTRQIIIGTEDHVEGVCENLCSNFMDHKFYDGKDYGLIKKLLSCNPDAILTTNYSYEIEVGAGLVPGTNRFGKAAVSTDMVKKRETKYYLHSFYSIDDKSVWHIHGEAKNKHSIVLGQYYYGRLLSRYINYLDGTKSHRRPQFSNNFKGTYEPKSWIDYFIYGNVYIVGFGLDVAEYDLWWLLNRKKNQINQKGKVVLFLNKYDVLHPEKEQMLRLFNVQIERDSSLVDSQGENYYKKYYNLVLDNIKDEMKSC